MAEVGSLGVLWFYSLLQLLMGIRPLKDLILLPQIGNSEWCSRNAGLAKWQTAILLPARSREITLDLTTVTNRKKVRPKIILEIQIYLVGGLSQMNVKTSLLY